MDATSLRSRAPFPADDASASGPRVVVLRLLPVAGGVLPLGVLPISANVGVR